MSYSFTAPRKDPSAVLDYEMDWSAWLAEGETITEHDVTCSDNAVTVSDISEADGVVRWRLAGGDAGASHIVTCEITTSADQIDQRSVLVQVRER